MRTSEGTNQEVEVPPAVKAEPAPKVKQPPLLFHKTQRMLEGVARLLDGPLVSYWSSAANGVCKSDLFAFHQVARKMGHQKKLYVVLKAKGGSGEAALLIVNLLRTFADRIVALVPFECTSAATMLALGADEIQMGELAVLSPIDTSLAHSLSPVDVNNERVRVGLDELQRVIARWRNERRDDAGVNPYRALFGHIHPLLIGAVDRANSLSVRLCQEILSFHTESPETARNMALALNADYPSPTYPITLPEARRLGLKAVEMSSELNRGLLELHELYSEMGQTARTDFSEIHFHDNEIVNIVEGLGLQVYFQSDVQWFYRAEERNWTSLHARSGWHRCELVRGELRKSRFHLR